MNYPSDIAELEAELERVHSIVERDETAMARSQRPQIEKLFLCSSRKLQQDLQDRLRRAKAVSKRKRDTYPLQGILGRVGE